MPPSNKSKPEAEQRPDPIYLSRRQTIERFPIGPTKLNELLQAGIIESSLVHGRRWINFASISRYARGES
jgi:hypothetical protein